MILFWGKFQLLMMLTGVCFFSALIYFRIKVANLIKDFLFEKTDPLNLSFFRIILFGFLLYNFDSTSTIWFSGLPRELLFPPVGSRFFISIVPINPSMAGIASHLFQLFCLTSLLGLFTRISIVGAVITGFYVLGIPQFFGKVTHYNHLLWFMMILAASRCADVLSLDALVKAVKRADRGLIDPSSAHARYTIPLRIIWIIIGFIYFFPGFWKLWKYGLQWIFSDNLKYHIFAKWMEKGGSLPFIRIDHFPWAYKSMALADVFFEISFIILIFFPIWRYIPVVAGLAFHNLANLIMKLPFWTLQISYAAFLNWARIFEWIGERIFPRTMHVLYDGNCELCRRTVAMIGTVDIFRRLHFINALESSQVKLLNIEVGDADLMRDIHAVCGNKIYKGFQSYRMMAWRLPLLWAFLPLLYIWPITLIGRKIYRAVADSRRCQVKKDEAFQNSLERNNYIPVAVIGSIIILINITFGAFEITKGWPFSCYPTYSYIMRGEIRQVVLEFYNTQGQLIILKEDDIKQQFSADRYRELIHEIFAIKDEDQKYNKIKALWNVFCRIQPELLEAKGVKIYEVVSFTDPAQFSLNPHQKSLANEFNF